MRELIQKLILGIRVTNADIDMALYEICDEVHSSCDNSCPVYELHNGRMESAMDSRTTRQSAPLLELSCGCKVLYGNHCLNHGKIL